MIINDAGRKIIETFEGCRLEAYLCPAGVWTIGFGHTGDVEKGMKITKHQAEVILEHDLERFEREVGELCPKANANQFSACVSFAFNVGVQAFKKSQLKAKLNAGAPLSAADEFLKWVNAGKNPDGTPRKLPGLVKRRAAERALFLTVPS